MRPVVIVIGAFALSVTLMMAVAVMRAAGQLVSNTNDESEEGPTIVDAAAEVVLNAAEAISAGEIMDRNAIEQDQQDANCDAFLQMIAQAEGTAGAVDQYAVCYGYRHVVQSFADHPAVTGEWRGEALDNLGPGYAGLVSTAAGRYQIKRQTWLGCRRALALPDFGPDSQDKAALYIVREAGALGLVRAGRFDEAVARCAGQWASLPGANAPGQRMRKLEDLRAAYVSAGGALA